MCGRTITPFTSSALSSQAARRSHPVAAPRSTFPGEFLVVPPDEVHALEDVADLEMANAYYLSEWLMSDLGLLWTEAGAVPLFLSTTLMKSQIVDIVQLRLRRSILSASQPS